MQEKAKEPEIRFAGFTGAWEQRKFGEMANRRSEVSASGNLPRVEYEDIVSGTGTLNKDVFEKQSQKQGIVFHSGDVLYGKLRPYLQNWLLASFNGLAVGDFWVLEPQGLNSNYLYRIIQTKQFDEIANQSVGTKMPRADWKLVSKATFLNPASFNEQRLIGKFFKDIDSLLTLHQRKYEKLLNIKKSMLEKMFPKEGEVVPEIRFKGFTGAWEQRKLSDIAERITRKNTHLESTLPLTISSSYGLIDQYAYFNNRVASRNTRNYYLIKNGEFAYNKSYSDGFPFGSVKRLDRYAMGVLSTLYIIFSIDYRKVNSDFLVSYYDTKNWHHQVALRAAEGARNHGLLNISADDFFETELKIPMNLDEQKKIGSFFDQLNSFITLHQRKLEMLKNVKQAFLEKMFV